MEEHNYFENKKWPTHTASSGSWSNNVVVPLWMLEMAYKKNRDKETVMSNNPIFDTYSTFDSFGKFTDWTNPSRQCKDQFTRISFLELYSSEGRFLRLGS